MARINNFVKTSKKNIVSLVDASGKKSYYANFMIEGRIFQKKNLTKKFNATTLKQAVEALEYYKSELRQDKDPFNRSSEGKVKEMVLKHIDKKEPVGESSAYKKSLEAFYYNYVDEVIGNLYLEKVNDNDIDNIMKSLKGYKKEYQQNLQILMYRIFEKELRRGNLKYNPFYDLNYGPHSAKPDFDTRLNEPIEDVARKLYKAVLEYKPRYRLLLLMSIMLVRRIGELYQLRLSNIKKYKDGQWYVLATKDITKTGVDEKYPLPEEIVNLLPLDLKDIEKYKNTPLFNFSMPTITLHYKKLVKEAKIDLNEGYSITSHDNRKLFISILSVLGTDSDLADRCLSHKKKGGMKQVYLDVPYEVRKKIFEKWWDFLRNQE